MLVLIWLTLGGLADDIGRRFPAVVTTVSRSACLTVIAQGSPRAVYGTG